MIGNERERFIIDRDHILKEIDLIIEEQSTNDKKKIILREVIAYSKSVMRAIK